MKNTVPNRLLHGLFILLLSAQVTAQDIHFSQFFEAPLLRNPALAGLFSGDLRIQTVYRTQWGSVTVPYQTISVNGESKLAIGSGEDYLTVGGEILYDKSGTAAMTVLHLLPTVNYHKSLSDEKTSYLSVGFMAGIVQRRLDRSKITTNSQFDGNSYNGNLADGETFNNPSVSYFDGSAGLSYNTQIGDNQDNNLFIGIAYHHFNKAAKISFYNDALTKITPKWVFSGGTRMKTSDRSYITFHGDYTTQGSYTEIIGGAMYSLKLDDLEAPKYLIHGGAFLRWKDAVIPVAKLEVQPIAISVSYDANISKLTTASRGRGGFELGITYQKFILRERSSRDAMRCPRF